MILRNKFCVLSVEESDIGRDRPEPPNSTGSEARSGCSADNLLFLLECHDSDRGAKGKYDGIWIILDEVWYLQNKVHKYLNIVYFTQKTCVDRKGSSKLIDEQSA